ncbi:MULTISPECIES: hypothetical protein [unclassified Microbacterium]|uniref:hypothetical protein n=1 Tax=unclassified Microbacterium TaxID=2609290 RepID=UPI0036528898
MTGRMQVLVDGDWVDVSRTVRGFELEEMTAVVDEVTAPPASFEMSVTVTSEHAAHMFAMLEEVDRRARAERARRRLWLRYPYRHAVSGARKRGGDFC